MKAQGVVVGCGARCSLGLNAIETAFLYRTGHVGMREAAILDALEQPTTMCLVPTLEPYLSGPDRVLALAEPALKEVIESLGALKTQLRIKLVLCFDSELKLGYPSGQEPAARLGAQLRSIAQRAAHENVVAEVVAAGPAGPGIQLETILGELSRGAGDVVIVGGLHSDYDRRIVELLEHQGRLFTPENLDALIPGEAAAFVPSPHHPHARRLQLPELARINGVGSAFEKAGPDNDESAFEAAGLTVALRRALAPLGEGKEAEKVGWMLSDLTFEMREVYEWQAVAARHQRYFCDPQHADFPAHRLGHMGAAALPLCLVLAAEAWRGGFAAHDNAVITAGSDTGERAAVLASAGRAAAPPAAAVGSPAAE